VTTLHLNLGYRCSCHHPSRRCFYQCGDTATAIRESDNRPVCSYCVNHDPANSAGFGFPAGAIEEATA
jgi:hypothetical protein